MIPVLRDLNTTDKEKKISTAINCTRTKSTKLRGTEVKTTQRKQWARQSEQDSPQRETRSPAEPTGLKAVIHKRFIV